jgi:hypothetical protein
MPTDNPRDRLLKQVVLRAATSPISLFLVTSGVLLVTSPVAWPVGGVLLAAEGAWLWSRIRDPSYARASSEDLQRRRWDGLVERLEAISGMLDRDTALALAAIVEAQERLLAACGSVTMVLPHTRAELMSLLEHCLSLAEKRYRLQNYLAACNVADAQRQAGQLEARIEQTQDPITRELYSRALDQKRQELENYVRLDESVARIDGQLTAVRCTFDNMLSKVLRTQTAHGNGSGDSTDAVFAELNHLASGVAALESSLQETLTVRGAG